MSLPNLRDFDFRQKKVLVRCDLDVPLEKGKIRENSRIRECLLTVQYLLEKEAVVILAGHLGRPEGKETPELMMMPVAEEIARLLNQGFVEKKEIGDFSGYKLGKNLFLLENLRFFQGEEANSPEFAEKLSSLADFYVNEAFGVSHRKHASIVGVPSRLPSVAGFFFEKEVENLSKSIKDPQRPVVFVIGGAKPETKLPFVYKFAEKADWVLVGGTLVRARDRVRVENNIIFADLKESGLDITEESIKKFLEIIAKAKTIVWNGPLGKYEDEKWEAGTREVAEAVAQASAYKIVGGGDTIASLTKFKLIDKMDYVSTAGGAMLEYLAEGSLPGIKALEKF